MMLKNHVDLLPSMGWDGDPSSLTLIRQKLVDERILLECASIQRKKETIASIEQLCQNVSYRTGADAKMSTMMAIIRTYRYSLNQCDKADELENKMRKGRLIDLVGEIKDM